MSKQHKEIFEDNPEFGMKDPRQYWTLKTALPSDPGRHEYNPDDLKLQNNK